MDVAAATAKNLASQDHDEVPVGPQVSVFRFTEEHYTMMQARLDYLTASVDEFHEAYNTRLDHFNGRLTKLFSSFNTMMFN